MKKVGIISHWTSNFIGMLGPLVVLPHQLNVLGVDEYGYLMATQYIAIQLLPVVDFGLSYAGPGWLKGQAKKSCDLLPSVLTASFFSWLLSLFFGLIYFYLNNPKQSGLFLLLHINTLSYMLPPAYFILHTGGQILYGIVGSIIKTAAIAWTFFALKSSDDVLFWAAGLSIISFFQSFIFLRGLFSHGSYRIQSFVIEALVILRIGVPEMFMRLAPMSILFFATQGILGFYGAKELALFSVVDKLRVVLGQICTPLISSYLAEHKKETTKSHENKWKIVVLFLPVIAFIGVSFSLSSWIVDVIKLSSIEGSIDVWKIASLCLLGEAFYQLFGAISAKKQNTRTWSQVFYSIIWAISGSIIIHYLLIPMGIGVVIFGMALWSFFAGLIFLKTKNKFDPD